MSDQNSDDRYTNLMRDIVVRDAQGAIQSVILMNGAAAVAVLAFVGALVGQNRLGMADIKPILASLRYFAGAWERAACAASSLM